MGRPRLGPWVPPWSSCTPLAAAELGQSLLDASRVAVDHLVQAEDSRTTGGRGRQREARGALLRKAAAGNRAAAPILLKLTPSLQVASRPLLALCKPTQVWPSITKGLCTGPEDRWVFMSISCIPALYLGVEIPAPAGCANAQHPPRLSLRFSPYLRFLGEGQLLLSPRPGPLRPPGPPPPPPLLPALLPGPGRRFCRSMPGR